MTKPKKILVIQYYKVKTQDGNYNINRQFEIDNCLFINCQNPLLDEIHLLTEQLYEFDFLPDNLKTKLVQVVVGERLSYKMVFEYYNKNIPNSVCILANSDIFTDNSLEILDHIQFDNTVLAINRYEYDSEIKAPLLYGLETAHNNKKFPNYSPVIWSQDAWIWKTDNMKFDGGNFCLGTCACDNHISFLLKNAGYLVYNPSQLLSINHYDRLSILKNENGIFKGIKSKKRDPPPSDYYKKMIHLVNMDDIVDKYTVSKEMFKEDNEICDYIYSLKLKKNVSKINYKLTKKTIDNTPCYEYEFDNFEYLCIIDIFGKECSKDNAEIGYASKVKFTYTDVNNRWTTYFIGISGIQEPNGNFIKRNYLPNPIPCKKCRICILEYVGQPQLNARFYGTNVSSYNIDEYAITEFNNEWQKPVITEYNVYKQIVCQQRLPYNYFAFPWATYVDEKRRKEDPKRSSEKNTNIMPMIENYLKNPTGLTYFTVIQHYRYKEIFPLFQSLNIKYVFTPHCTLTDIENAKTFDIQLFGFQLFPSMKRTTETLFTTESRRLLTSFVGQYDPKCYLSEIRPRIFDLFSKYDDCFVLQRKSWHFQDYVYNNLPTTNEDFENEYKQLLNNSKFSLCPSGSGPNSIRIWESMSFGSIPVILADDFVLPEVETMSWDDSVIFWKESEIDKLYDYLKSISNEEIEKKRAACISMFNKYFNEDVFCEGIFENIKKLSL
jgi:Exostosin family